MQYSNTTTKDGIIQFTEALTKLGDGGITNDPTLFLQINGYVNQAYKKVISALLKVDQYWKWDDSNNSDFPTAYITLISGQRDYDLPAATLTADPSSLYKVNQISVLQSDGVTWTDLILMNPDEDETTTTGVPTKYRLIGNSIRVSDLPLTGKLTLTNGLRVKFQRGASYFTSSDITKQPGFLESYHDLLAYDAAATYLMPYNPELSDRYSRKFDTRLALLQSDYAYRNDDVKSRIVPAKQNNK